MKGKFKKNLPNMLLACCECSSDTKIIVEFKYNPITFGDFKKKKKKKKRKERNTLPSKAIIQNQRRGN